MSDLPTVVHVVESRRIVTRALRYNRREAPGVSSRLVLVNLGDANSSHHDPFNLSSAVQLSMTNTDGKKCDGLLGDESYARRNSWRRSVQRALTSRFRRLGIVAPPTYRTLP